MKQKVTIYDIARAAGVSQQTVSLALNNKGQISPATQARIVALSKEMGYRPNRMAQAMRSSQSHIIGIVIPNINNPFFSEVVRGAQDTAKANGYNTIISNTDNSQEIEELLGLVSHGIDGVITFIHQSKDQAIIDFANKFGPILLMNREFNTLPDHPSMASILVNSAGGAKSAVSHLVELGHKKIGMITGTPYHDRSPTGETARAIGYREGLTEAGIEPDLELLVEEHETLDGGYRAAKLLLQKRPDVTAIFAYNDLMAFGALRAAHELGLAVPTDLSIIGFDDTELTTMSVPTLSTVQVDQYKMGQLAFERLHALIQDPESPRELINMQTKVIQRESTAVARS